MLVGSQVKPPDPFLNSEDVHQVVFPFSWPVVGGKGLTWEMQ